MQKHHHIVIAGAGGIAQAAGLILAEWSQITPTIYIGNRSLSKAKQVIRWIENGSKKTTKLIAFRLEQNSLSHEMKTVFEQADILLDCLPGKLAPNMAAFAKDFQMHYANLTEYVAETDEIKAMAKDASTGFVLQTGLAPGYIDVLANDLFQQFCRQYQVDQIDRLEMKVGALSDHAVAPHYYGFTWSPVGVATEYLKDALVLRDYKKTSLPALSERSVIIINGIAYEDDLTSGGAADLPDALAGKVRSLDYKTLRHPGHYAWVQAQIAQAGGSDDPVARLQQIMEKQIPHIEDDQIILYAAAQGKDKDGTLRRLEIAKKIGPQKVGKHTLRAIQTTTAVPLIQAAQWLLETSPRGVILQSEIDTKAFLNGDFINRVYGRV